MTGSDRGEPVDRPKTGGGSAGSLAPEHVASLGRRAVIQLVVRSAATRLISFVGMVALARLLTPEDFGVYAVVTFAVVLLTLIGDAGIAGALIQQADPPTDRELATALTFQIGIWTAVLAAVWALAAIVPSFVAGIPPAAPDLARLLGLGAWLGGLRAVPSVMLTRVLRFAPMALLEVIQQVVFVGLAVALAATGHGVVSFGIAAVAHGLVGTIALWLIYGHRPGLGFDLAIARRMWGFGLSFQLGYVLYWARDSVVAVFGGLAGGLQGVGFVQFAWRNGQFAVSVEESVSRVAFPAFSRLQAGANGPGSVAAAAIEVGFLAIAVVQGWLAGTAPSLVPIVFSDRWVPATLAFQLVCIGSLAWAPVFILRAFVNASGNSRLGLGLAAFSLATVYILFPVLTAPLGLAGAGIAYAVSAVAALLAYVRATRGALVFPWPTIGRIVIETMIAGAGAAIVIGIVPGAPGLAVSAVVYVAVFAVLLAVVERDLVRRSMSMFRRGASAETSGLPAL